jgi:hypothetical protein
MTDLPSLPVWAKTLQRRIRQRGLDFFILYGPGVRDLPPLGARRFGTISAFLTEEMFGDRAAVVTYDRGAGIGLAIGMPRTTSGPCSTRTTRSAGRTSPRCSRAIPIERCS